MNQFARPGLAVTELPSFNENDNGKILKINGESGKLGWEQQGGLLPQVTSADNGKVMSVVDGAWAASEQGKKFIVTLTPTALDYSGTMDKTVAEINAAYEAGMEIVFRVMESATTYTEVFLSAVYHDGATYPSFNAFIVGSDANVLIFAGTVTTNDGTKQTYSTTIYSLTPAS